MYSTQMLRNYLNFLKNFLHRFTNYREEATRSSVYVNYPE